MQIGIVIGTIEDGITDHFTSYIKPKKEVMWQASRIHGITTKDLQDSPTYLSLWPDIQRYLSGRILIAHACGTEKRYLRSFPGHSFGPWVDSLTLAKASIPEIPSHSLGKLLPFLGDDFENLDINRGRKWHDALYDAAASFSLVHTLVTNLSLDNEPLSILLNPNTQKYHALKALKNSRLA